MAADDGIDIATLTDAELNQLYEDLHAALGPAPCATRAELEDAVRALRARAAAMRIRPLADPLVESGPQGGGGSARASERWHLYRDGMTVDEWVTTHGEGPHLRLDLLRGNIALEGG